MTKTYKTIELDLGKYKDKKVTTNPRTLTNEHIATIGSSGTGKSAEDIRLCNSAAEQGATVVAFDMHGTLDDDQILPAYRNDFFNYKREVNPGGTAIRCNLFDKMIYQDGTPEDFVNAVGGITDIFSDAIHAGSEQSAELRKAVAEVMETEAYKSDGIIALDRALLNAGNKTAEKIREKLYYLTANKVFVQGEGFLESQKINIFRLSKFNLKTQKMIAEILLMYLWRLACAGAFKDKGIYIFIDECQNLPAGKDNALAMMLSEGRKFGINLILATQMILQGTTSAVQQRLAQCGLMLYFKPAANRVALTARMIDPVRETDWARLLRTLKVGEFIADGSFLVDGKERLEPLKISAYVDNDVSDRN